MPVPLHRTRLRERGAERARDLLRLVIAALAQAFRVERSLAGMNLAIVDDVVTTGATVNALAAALNGAGAARCIAVAVARTPEPDQKRNV